MRQICELVKSSINDADSETRAAGRKAFAKLDEFHSEEADALFQELDHAKQKMLRGGDAASSWASVNSDKGSMPLRSKLSAGSKVHSNISASEWRLSFIKMEWCFTEFLAQRSASAIDPKATKFAGSSRLVRPTSTKTVARQDTSPAGCEFVDLFSIKISVFSKNTLPQSPRISNQNIFYYFTMWVNHMQSVV